MTDGEGNLGVRPLIVGAGGLVGRVLTDLCEERYPHTVSATKAELDVADRWRLEAEFERLAPTVVVNCAAVSDVDLCEADPDLARRVNAEGPANLAAACRAVGARLVHLSTDYVFDGAKGAEYVEDDLPAPLNEYGRSKLEGELAALGTLEDCAVLRLSFIVGAGRETLLSRLLDRARSGPGTIPVVDGWIKKPTYVGEAAAAAAALMASAETGIWHFADGPALSRFGFARRAFELCGEDPRRLAPLDPAEAGLDAARPAATPLATGRFAARFFAPRPWDEAAAEYLAALRRRGTAR